MKTHTKYRQMQALLFSRLQRLFVLCDLLIVFEENVKNEKQEQALKLVLHVLNIFSIDSVLLHSRPATTLIPSGASFPSFLCTLPKKH